MLNSAVSAFYYLRIIWYMYFEEPKVMREQKPSPALLGALVVSAGALIVLFIFSGPILDAARSSMPTIVAMLTGR